MDCVYVLKSTLVSDSRYRNENGVDRKLSIDLILVFAHTFAGTGMGLL
jgi:hypothetical protein